VGLLVQTAQQQGATLVIATHDARVAIHLSAGVEGQSGFQRLSLQRQALQKAEQLP
jgi:ABC-type lipoprotein export system ATPase subunit